MRSDCATSQTIVRLPARAAARPSEAATVVFPTPPFPVTNRRRLSRRDAIGQKDSSPIVRIRTPRQGLFDQWHPPETKALPTQETPEPQVTSSKAKVIAFANQKGGVAKTTT